MAPLSSVFLSIVDCFRKRRVQTARGREREIRCVEVGGEACKHVPRTNEL